MSSTSTTPVDTSPGVSPSATKKFAFTQTTSAMHLNEISDAGVPTYKGDLPLVSTPSTFEIAHGRIYTENGTGGLDVYDIQKGASTVTLNHVGSALTPSNPSTWLLCVTPDGTSVSIVEYFTNRIHTFKVDATSGAASFVGTVTAGTSAVGCITSQDSKYMYVANYDSSNVSMFSINATTKAMTSLGSIASDPGTSYITNSSDGRFIFVSNQNAATMRGFEINSATGMLTDIGGRATCSDPDYIDSDGAGHIYVGCQYSAFQLIPFDSTAKTFGTPVTQPMPTIGWFHASKDFKMVFQYATAVDVRTVADDGTVSSSVQTMTESSSWTRTALITF